MSLQTVTSIALNATPYMAGAGSVLAASYILKKALTPLPCPPDGKGSNRWIVTSHWALIIGTFAAVITSIALFSFNQLAVGIMAVFTTASCCFGAYLVRVLFVDRSLEDVANNLAKSEANLRQNIENYKKELDDSKNRVTSLQKINQAQSAQVQELEKQVALFSKQIKERTGQSEQLRKTVEQFFTIPDSLSKIVEHINIQINQLSLNTQEAKDSQSKLLANLEDVQKVFHSQMIPELQQLDQDEKKTSQVIETLNLVVSKVGNLIPTLLSHLEANDKKLTQAMEEIKQLHLDQVAKTVTKSAESLEDVIRKSADVLRKADEQERTTRLLLDEAKHALGTKKNGE